MSRSVRDELSRLLLAGALAFAMPGMAVAEQAPVKAAIFAAEMNDPTLPYGRKSPPAEVKRLELVTEVLRTSMVDKGGIESVDLASQGEEINKQSPLYKCNGCWGDIAKAAGADLAITTVAEKGSTQIFNLTVTIAEAASGQIVRRGNVVISANTDDDWRHAMRWVVKNRLLAEPLPNRS